MLLDDVDEREELLFDRIFLLMYLSLHGGCVCRNMHGRDACNNLFLFVQYKIQYIGKQNLMYLRKYTVDYV